MTVEKGLGIAMTAERQTDPVDAICPMADVSGPSLYRAFGSEDGHSRAAPGSYAGALPRSCHDAGGRPGRPCRPSVAVVARYRGERVARAVTRRASGEAPARIPEMPDRALSVVSRP